MNDDGIYVSADRWRSLRTNPAFLELLRLGRIVNSINLRFLEDVGASGYLVTEDFVPMPGLVPPPP